MADAGLTAHGRGSKNAPTMKNKSISLIIAMLVIAFAGKALADDKAGLTTEVNDAKATLVKTDAGLKDIMEKAKGYVIFPSVAKGGLGIGAAAGTGQLLEAGTAVGETTLRQVSIGLQAGGQAYIELICFEDQTSLDNFKKGNFEFSAQVSAVAVTSGVSKTAKYEKGIMVLTLAKGGLMYEASVGGQKFKYQAY
jgi:lipid-binding SYLF domain-containing protein